MTTPWTIETNGPTNGNGPSSHRSNHPRDELPIVAVALHGGHRLRREVERCMALDEATRRREEDPCTDVWARAFPARVIVNRSRFEVDMNRPQGSCVYTSPETAWGLDVWRPGLPDEVADKSRQLHRAFYGQVRDLLAGLVERWGHVIVLDLHSYNHRRGGPEAPADDPRDRPDINIGTGSMDRRRWGQVVESFMDGLRQPLGGPSLDVRENVCFRGGYFPTWVHQTFPDSVCALAVEVKKTYMNEWSGRVLASPTHRIGRLVRSAGESAAAALSRPMKSVVGVRM